MPVLIPEDVLFLVLRAALLLFLTWFLYKTWRTLQPRGDHSLRSVAILVLGDIGRSPRMMYHAQSFAETGFTTDLIGYGGSKPIPSLERLPRIRLRYIPELPRLIRHLPFLILAPIKVFYQVVYVLLALLVWIEVPPEFILVQNPPSIPSLALVQLVGRIRGSKVIIDWHNLGYSILALKLGPNHLLVRIAKWYETTIGRQAYAHLCVTNAMRDFLVKEWHLQNRLVVLYDRPPRYFHRSSTQETHELFQRLQSSLACRKDLHDFLPQISPPYSTALTHTAEGRILPIDTFRAKIASPIGTPTENIPAYKEVHLPSLRPDRPALVVSSTSWTPDEDFSILLEALQIYEMRAEDLSVQGFVGGDSLEEKLPKLLVIVTGKGPLRDQYMKKISGLQAEWKWVRCISLWLDAADYPILLGSADLGVCLHSSSSGLDLPMKVIDMFGCGLPVCALDFACIRELVKENENGLIFKNAAQMAEQLEELLLTFPNASRLARLSASLYSSTCQSSTISNSRYHGLSESEKQWSTWDENWGRVMRPLILTDVKLEFHRDQSTPSIDS